MTKHFQTIIDRTNTRSAKWDLRELLFKEKDVLPMWVADMDFQSPAAVQEAIINRAKHNIYGYNITDAALAETIANWLKKRHQWEVDTSWLSYSPGVVTSLHMIVQALTKEEDSILIQTPVYPPFYSAIEKHNRTIVKNSLKLKNNRYEIDFADFEEKVKDDKVTMFILCSPHNPIGRVWTEEELTKMAKLCMDNNVILVSDEIHADLVYKQYKHIPVASLKSLEENIVTCMAPSKTFNLAGLQASYIVTPNKKWKKKIDEQFKSQGLMGLNTYGIVGMEAAYLHGEQWLEDLMDVLEENKKYVTEQINMDTEKITVLPSEGTYLLWLDCRGLNMEEEELKQFFQRKAKVGLNAGETFGEEGKGFMRMNIASPFELVQEGVSRILNALSTL